MVRRPGRASGIVLAGGRAQRFGTDKLAVELAGRSLLEHAVAAVAAICDEVIVVVPPVEAAGPTIPLRGMGSTPIRIARDEQPFGGPLLGLLAGLRETRHPLALVVGGDMPALPPGLLGAMLAAVGTAEPTVPADRRPPTAVALRTESGVHPLPLVLPSAALAIVERLVTSGRRALRDVLEALPVRVLEPREWGPYDPDGTALADVDRVADLRRLGGAREGSRRTRG